MEHSAEIRNAFLQFFEQRGHTVVPSAPLVPANDPSLLFTNAGMVQFKDVFLGKESPGYSRAATSQRCLRAGGKHNDLENVGYTARHHTFFEMLGNFSFGDYFKREAIHYAWDFLTRVVELPEARLWVTVYEDDEQAADIWLNDIGVSAERFARIGEADNFWAMGDTGPCGPCTEIFYDFGESVAGGPPGTADQDGDRYVEVWNLVFMQHERDARGKLTDLPKPSVDTGMGLERLSTILQGVTSNYDTDLFAGIIARAADIAQVADTGQPSLRVVADHIRACAFMIVDGVLPSNEGRGYVLRRIIRRAARHGHKLGIEEPFFYRLVQPLADSLGEACPELSGAQERVQDVLQREEQRFGDTLAQGMRILHEEITRLTGDTLPGETVFKLYDTYGFPSDLTADFAREQNLKIDTAGFEKHMQAQRERGRLASRFDVEYDASLAVSTSTEFTGYDGTHARATVQEIFVDHAPVREILQGQSGGIILEKTPFYAESGGQVGDRGTLECEQAVFEVADTQKQGDAHVHYGTLASGRLALGHTVRAQVAAERRQATVLNHSATHLMHAALREVLGDHVEQKGSLVAPDRLRFDFSHDAALDETELQRIEDLVNHQIRLNAEATAKIVPKDEALHAGALALFGEKYADEVRVLSIGDFSMELCGGTHVSRAGDIGVFKIISESGVASGVRRIEALTGDGALEWIRENQEQLSGIAGLMKSSRLEARDKVGQLLERNRTLQKELDRLKSQVMSRAGSGLADQAVEVEGIQVLACEVEGADPRSLRETVDRLKDRLGSAAIVLGTVRDSRVSLVAGVTRDQVHRITAGELVNAVARQVGGKGGGRDDMAQAGGNQPDRLAAALESVPGWVQSSLQE